MRSQIPRGHGARRPEEARPASRFGPVRGFGLPAPAGETAAPVDLPAWQDRAERFGHHLPEGPPVQAMMRTRSGGGSGGRDGGEERRKKKEEDERISEEELRKLLGEEDEEEIEEEDDDTPYLGEKKEKQAQKSRERREKIRENKSRGGKVDTSSGIFKLGTMARASSKHGRDLLEEKYSKSSTDLATTTQAIETSTGGALSLPSVPPFAVLAGLRNAKTVPESITSIKTKHGSVNRPNKRHRKTSVAPGPARLNTLVVPGLGTYEDISKKQEKPSETLLSSLENARDRSSGETTHIHRRLRKSKKVPRKVANPVMELVGANDNDPLLEALKTENVGQTVSLLEGSDVQLASTSGGQPVLGGEHHQSLFSLAEKPGSPTREDAALLSSFRIARESEELSGIQSPTPEELQKYRGYSQSWAPPTREKKEKKKRKRKKKRKKKAVEGLKKDSSGSDEEQEEKKQRVL